jgi:hypothetical protein
MRAGKHVSTSSIGAPARHLLIRLSRPRKNEAIE